MHLGLSGGLGFRSDILGGATPDLSLEYFVRVQGLHVSFGVFFFFPSLLSLFSYVVVS